MEVHVHEVAPRTSAPVLYVHGVPNSGEMWRPFLDRTGGLAPDLPGFGLSAKPADFDYSIGGYARVLRELVDGRGLDRLSIVVHDWGVVGLALAQELAGRVERLVVMNCVPLMPGYRWHRIARIWRTPLAGEMFMGFSTRWGLKQLSREGTTRPGPMPDEFIDAIWRHFDHGTQRAILKLYRSSPPAALAAAGERLGTIGAESLVVWGGTDPYIATEWGERYGEALGARVEIVDAGHWPWVDRPEVVDLVAGFLLA